MQLFNEELFRSLMSTTFTADTTPLRLEAQQIARRAYIETLRNQRTLLDFEIRLWEEALSASSDTPSQGSPQSEQPLLQSTSEAFPRPSGASSPEPPDTSSPPQPVPPP